MMALKVWGNGIVRVSTGDRNPFTTTLENVAETLLQFQQARGTQSSGSLDIGVFGQPGGFVRFKRTELWVSQHFPVKVAELWCEMRQNIANAAGWKDVLIESKDERIHKVRVQVPQRVWAVKLAYADLTRGILLNGCKAARVQQNGALRWLSVGNVHETGSICWPVRIGRLRVMSLAEVDHAWMSSQFNMDLNGEGGWMTRSNPTVVTTPQGSAVGGFNSRREVWGMNLENM